MLRIVVEEESAVACESWAYFDRLLVNTVPVFTMGGMRTQQSWGRGDATDITAMSSVDPECQSNFVAILERALELGINHFETARGYGCSELQYGDGANPATF